MSDWAYQGRTQHQAHRAGRRPWPCAPGTVGSGAALGFTNRRSHHPARRKEGDRGQGLRQRQAAYPIRTRRGSDRHSTTGHAVQTRTIPPWQIPPPSRVENFFQRMKRFRAIATRYDKLSLHFLSAVQLVAVLDWIRFRV